METAVRPAESGSFKKTAVHGGLMMAWADSKPQWRKHTTWKTKIGKEKEKNTMKNMRKLAVISLVVMMMVTAVGYALWSDAVEVDGTATTAKFGVRFISAGATPGICYDGEDKATFSVDKVLPGETRHIKLVVLNEGNVEAKLAPADLRVDMSDNIFLQFQVVSTASSIPAGQTGEILIDISIDPTKKIPGSNSLLINQTDGQMIAYSDTFTVTADYKQ